MRPHYAPCDSCCQVGCATQTVTVGIVATGTYFMQDSATSPGDPCAPDCNGGFLNDFIIGNGNCSATATGTVGTGGGHAICSDANSIQQTCSGNCTDPSNPCYVDCASPLAEYNLISDAQVSPTGEVIDDVCQYELTANLSWDIPFAEFPYNQMSNPLIAQTITGALSDVLGAHEFMLSDDEPSPAGPGFPDSKYTLDLEVTVS